MNIYQDAWKNIVRPTQIHIKKHLFGPAERMINGHKIIKVDLEVFNRNNKKISGILYYAPDIQAEDTIIYLHGNGGSKIQVLPLVPLIPKYKLNVVSFDFVGCGNSDPDTLTYGVNQMFDIRDILEEARKYTHVGRATLWGRSMGAVSSIMFSEMYPYEVNGLILDSPFKSLSEVVDRIAGQMVPLPIFLLKPILYFVKNRAAKQANYDIFSIDYLSVFKKLNPSLPVLFIFSHADQIVPVEEVFQFYSAYKGPKDLCQIYQTHDQDRNEDLFNQGIMWLKRSKRKNVQSNPQVRQIENENRRQKSQISATC